MNYRPGDWMKQVTTGHGAMIIGPTLVAVASGTMPWDVAVPLLLAGLVGLLWPEGSRALWSASAEPLGVEAIISAYRLGMEHAAASAPPPKPARPTLVPPASAICLLAAAGLSLAACVHPVEPVRIVDVNTMATAGATRAARHGAPLNPLAMAPGRYSRGY
ncbi:MAG: hypothetical protein AB7F35_07340 [Acetobacteraceae bacterium]